MALGGRFGGWNEGSLLRRTLLYVGTFVLGSLAFLGIASLVLTSIAKGVLPSHDPKDDESPGASGTAAATASPSTKPASLKGLGGKRRPGAAARDTETPTPPSDEEE